MVSRRTLGPLVAITLGTAVFGSWLALQPSLMSVAHFADAEDTRMVMLGKKTYMGHCASCHGEICKGNRCGN
jgi:mono/diheme cytochrome c family protein